MMMKLLSAAVVAVTVASSAFAVTVTNDRLLPGTDAATFASLAATSTTLSPGATWLDAPAVVTGNLSGQYRSPFEGTPQFAGTNYFNITGADGVSVLTLSTVRSTLSFLWGSVDTYNSVKLINTLTGASTVVTLANLLNPETPQDGLGASLVTIAGFSFDKVEFRSTGNSFELASVAAVPLPAGGLLLLCAIGGIAALRRRKSA
jgi:hypothetical protein